MAALPRGLRALLTPSPNDIVLLSALRTPVSRAKKGPFRDAHDHELLATVLRATLAANPSLDPASISDVQIGTVLSELGGSKAGRMAALHAGVPHTAGFATVNRACSSGLAAVTGVAQGIALGSIEVGIGGGMESMSRNYGSRAIPTALWEGLRNSENKDARDCIMSMGLTAENVAERYGVSRADQDAFAVESHTKAAKAQKEGLFDEEIVETKVHVRPDPTVPEQVEEVVATKDDGIRPGSTVEKLAGMKPAFKEGGTATAGNSSQVSDGAAAVLMMRRSTATKLGLEKNILAKWAGTVTVGCKPDEMGVGPAVAIPRLMEYTGINIEDVGIWEINEAFASQALYCIRTLGVDMQKVNPKGGAIALGHPLGATGARQLATLLPELRRQDERLGVVSMCIGTGMGMASLIVRE
ncbi:beta ketoadipyl CoA thiolase, TH2 [Myriangium duriaei CBS 260.36]|uniref:acetyl-CoA C-acyltransferase n=1 Tax=Myriangium duriaei CBS 260.36 TaxID=1168546 RepID=A0A9P4MEE5_9PEZI|nr:beta ketoadipyl CoA thiolase, TH2 [Myriangium duriaei CBS 260.36]